MNCFTEVEKCKLKNDYNNRLLNIFLIFEGILLLLVIIFAFLFVVKVDIFLLAVTIILLLLMVVPILWYIKALKKSDNSKIREQVIYENNCKNKSVNYNKLMNYDKIQKLKISSLVTIQEKLKSVVPEISRLVEDENICKIFTNFLIENHLKLSLWSFNLFIVEFSNDECDINDVWFRSYLDAIKELKKNEKLNEIEIKILNLLEAAYDSCIMSSFYIVDNEFMNDHIFACCNFKESSLENSLMITDNDTIEYKILQQYKEVLEFKDAVEETDIIKNFTCEKFFILLQYFICIERNNLLNELIKKFEIDLTNINNFDQLLKEVAKDKKYKKQDVTRLLYLIYGNYGMGLVADETQSFYTLDDGMSFLELEYYDVEAKKVIKSTAEKVKNYYKKLEKNDYINRLSIGEKNINKISIEDVDLMSGREFEMFVGKLFQNLGYNIIHTKHSNDQGVDILAEASDQKIAIQCKCYSGTVGNAAIQEIVAGAKFYDANKMIVVTNSSFTKSAIQLALKNNVHLWDRITLIEKINGVDNG